MMNLNAYISFNGDCEEALNFYSRCLEGRVNDINYYRESPLHADTELKDKVLHAEFQFLGGTFMACDSMSPHNITRGDNINLSINFNDIKTMEKYFNALSEGGVITMPLQDQFWGARFGMLRDKFGINWMFNCNLAKK